MRAVFHCSTKLDFVGITILDCFREIYFREFLKPRNEIEISIVDFVKHIHVLQILFLLRASHYTTLSNCSLQKQMVLIKEAFLHFFLENEVQLN